MSKLQLLVVTGLATRGVGWNLSVILLQLGPLKPFFPYQDITIRRLVWKLNSQLYWPNCLQNLVVLLGV